MKFVKVLTTFAVVFLIGEVACRVFMPSYVKIIDNKTNKRIWLSELIESSKEGKRFKPNLDLTVYNAWISYYPKLTLKTNSLGLRSDDSSLNGREKRILLLGDSITWSGYLPVEKTFVKELENLLNKEKEFKVKTINAGIGDVGLEEEILFLKEIIDKINPKLVILSFYLNDSRPSVGFETEKGLYWAKLLQKSRLIDVIYNNIRVQMFLMRNNLLGKGYRYRWLYLSKNPQWIKDRAYFRRMISEANLDWGAAWEDDSWGMVNRNIDELKSISREKGFKLFIVCFPVSFQVYAEFLEDIPQRRLADICAKSNILFLDLLPKLRENNNSALFYDQCHLNIAGQSIVSEELARFIINNKAML